MIYKKVELDHVVLDIEFLLISVVQGVALTALATGAIDIIGNMKLEYLPYVMSGFLLILTFWSQAMIHALSFIDWPLDLMHGFLYFLASFIEVITFSQLSNPQKWFVFIIIFFIVAAILYIFDWRVIVSRKKQFQKSVEFRKLYQHMYNRQKFELFVILPLGFIYNIIAVSIIYLYPDIFIVHHWHIIIAIIQVVFSLILLNDSIKSFNKRSILINDSFKD